MLAHDIFPSKANSHAIKPHEISSTLFTPTQYDRPTSSASKYENYRKSLHSNENETTVNKQKEISDHLKSRSYDVTSIKKNAARLNDELIRSSNENYLNEHQVVLPFPAEHPYSSHVSKLSLFPEFTSEDSESKYYKTIVQHKTKGSPYRYEHQKGHENNPNHGELGFKQLIKPEGRTQRFYPIPSKAVFLSSRENKIRPKTATSLRNIEREHQATTYNFNYTGDGPVGSFLLDNYSNWYKEDRRLNTKSIENLKAYKSSYSSFVRPFEGRYADSYKNRYNVSRSYGHPSKILSVSDVMDTRSYVSLPKEKEEINVNEESLEDEFTETLSRYEDINKSLELQNRDNKNLKESDYLKRVNNYKDLEEENLVNVLQMVYKPQHQILQLRQKTNQLPQREKPRAVWYQDNLSDLYKTKLKKLGESIELDKKIHNDLVCSSYKETGHEKTKGIIQRQITEQPRPSQDLKIKGKAFSQRGQNHGSESIKEYVPKTNPYSLSSDPNHPECNQNKHKSILKRPDSPTKCRKISFNEVVKVASSGHRDSLATTSELLTTSPNIRLATATGCFRSKGRVPNLRPDVSPIQIKSAKVSLRSQANRSELNHLKDSWSKSAAYQKFYKAYPESAPDLRLNPRRPEFADNSADLRYTRSVPHRERRHVRQW